MYQSIDVQRRFVQERIAQNVNYAAELRRSGAPAPSIRRVRRSLDHLDRRAGRGGAITRAGSVPLMGRASHP